MDDGWKWDERLGAYLLGEEHEGCGVFWDNGGWRANVCVGDFVEHLGPFKTPENAKEQAFKNLRGKQEDV